MMLRLAVLVLCLLMASPALAGPYVGDFPTSATLQCYWNTNDQTGASITRSTDGTLKVYKNDSLTERTSLLGITQTEDMGADAHTGVHKIHVDTSDNTDAGFYAAGNEYHLVMTAMTIDTKTVNAHICSFSIERSGGVLALLKARTPNAAAGAAGGLLISGSNAGTTTLGALTVTGATTYTGNVTYSDGIAVPAPSTLNRAALSLAGNGTAPAFSLTGGATAPAFRLIGGSTSGEGILCTTTSGDCFKLTPTAGHGLNAAANGTDKHGAVLTGGTAGISDGLKAVAGVGGKDIRGNLFGSVESCTGCTTAGGTTLMPAAAYVKGSTNVIEEIFIRDSTTNQGKTGLTNASVGLTISWGRADQGNNPDTTCAVAAATRGTYTSCGFVEKDATNAPGVYEVGIPTATVASGSDLVTFKVFGVSGTLPTHLRIDLVDTGLAAINSKLGTPAGSSMSADTAAVKGDTAAIKLKTDSLGFTGANVNAIVATYATGQIPLKPTVEGRTLDVSATGAAGIDLANVEGQGTTLTLSGTTISSVSGSIGSLGAGAITSGTFGSGAINRAALNADTGLQSIRSSTAQAGGATTITLDASSSATAGYYVGAWAVTTGGTGVGQARVITAYDGATKVATIGPAWATNPDATTTFAIVPAAQVTGVQGNLSGSVGSVTGGVTVTTNSDKTGYSLTQAFPTNFATTLIDGTGLVTAGGTIRKNVASQKYPIYLVDSSGNPVTGATVTVRVSKDAAVSVVISGTVTEIDATNFSGWYSVNLAAADTNCTMCAYKATSATTVPRAFFFSTGP